MFSLWLHSIGSAETPYISRCVGSQRSALPAAFVFQKITSWEGGGAEVLHIVTDDGAERERAWNYHYL